MRTFAFFTYYIRKLLKKWTMFCIWGFADMNVMSHIIFLWIYFIKEIENGGSMPIYRLMQTLKKVWKNAN